MPSLFDDIFGGETTYIDENGEAALNEGATEDATTPAADSWDDQMSEVELRLKKASYYRTLLDDRLFTGDDDQIALDIEKEVRQFARMRLGVLLNLSAETTAASLFSTQEVEALKGLAAAFTVQEVTVLKTLAAKVLSRPGLITPKAEPPAPKAPPAPPPKPALRKRETPEAPKAPPKKTVVKSTPKTNPKAALQKGGGPPPPDGTLLEEGGRTYKVRWFEVEPGYEPPPGVGKVVQGNSVFKVLKMDITRQKSAEALPMPTGYQMEQVSAMRAAQAVNLAPTTMAEIAHRNAGTRD